MTLLHAKWMGASTQNSQTHIIMVDSKSPAFFPTFVTNALFLRVCGFHVPSPDILGPAYSTLRLKEKSVRQQDFGPRRSESQHPFRFFIRAVFFLHLRPVVTLDMTWQLKTSVLIFSRVSPGLASKGRPLHGSRRLW